MTMLLLGFTASISAATINVPGDYASIQTAINASSNGDLILVDNGTYTLTTFISITKSITLKSVNGPDNTFIDGNGVTKCIEINNFTAVVDGFTIMNGYNPGSFGGGVNIKNGGTVQNCIIKDNQARDGGGVAIDDSGAAINCIIKNNLASDNGSSGYGGGVRLLNGGEARNCLITENVSIKYGGGVNIWNAGNVFSCTITKNDAPYGAGIRTRNNSNVKNTIIYYNTGGVNWEVNGAGYSYYNCATTPALGVSYSTNCISSVPDFENIGAGTEDYHLKLGSACIDAGLNQGWMNTAFDLDGEDRIYNSTVDMGCYEYHTPAVIDTDVDGIPDDEDDFPDDPDRAFVNYFPAAGYNSLAYEDLWPGKGDYDFNDIVVDYRFSTITNADNKVVEIFGSFILKASGAFLRNGFGFNLPDADPNLVNDLNVTGSDLNEGYISLNGNGTEAGQSLPTIIVFDDAFNLLPHPGVGIGVNTENWAPFVPYDTVLITMTPNNLDYVMNDFLLESWNPFIIVNHERGKEVHLIDHAPTDLANLSYFGTWEDKSNPGEGKWYRTENNLPWAINIADPFEWPREKIEINWAYLHFIEWAESEGVEFDDWYKDFFGYRTNSNLYDPNTP